jgi:hypothetical protein
LGPKSVPPFGNKTTKSVTKNLPPSKTFFFL